MDSSCCCDFASKRIHDTLHTPLQYLIDNIILFLSLMASPHWFHCVPTCVFLVSIAIFLRNHEKTIYYLTKTLKKNDHIWAHNAAKFLITVAALLFSFGAWIFTQELVYCMTWFLTSESINPELRDQWWFRTENSTHIYNENMKMFTKIIPPHVLAWIIMTLGASLSLVISINNSSQPVNPLNLYENVFYENNLGVADNPLRQERLDSEESDIEIHERMFVGDGPSTLRNNSSPVMFNLRNGSSSKTREIARLIQSRSIPINRHNHNINVEGEVQNENDDSEDDDNETDDDDNDEENNDNNNNNDDMNSHNRNRNPANSNRQTVTAPMRAQIMTRRGNMRQSP